MISDVFRIQPETITKTLDRIEHIGSCYAFDAKELSQIRLLAEESISAISQTLPHADGRAWVTTEEGAFAVTIDCDAGAGGLNKKTKDSLLTMGGSPPKKGVFGKIEKVFDYLNSTGADYNAVLGCSLITHYGVGIAPVYDWSPEFEQAWKSAAQAGEDEIRQGEQGASIDADQLMEGQNLEISIVERYADDIRVYLKKDRKHGTRLEITVVKRFREGQVTEIEFA